MFINKISPALAKWPPIQCLLALIGWLIGPLLILLGGITSWEHVSDSKSVAARRATMVSGLISLICFGISWLIFLYALPRFGLKASGTSLYWYSLVAAGVIFVIDWALGLFLSLGANVFLGVIPRLLIPAFIAHQGATGYVMENESKTVHGKEQQLLGARIDQERMNTNEKITAIRTKILQIGHDSAKKMQTLQTADSQALVALREVAANCQKTFEDLKATGASDRQLAKKSIECGKNDEAIAKFAGGLQTNQIALEKSMREESRRIKESLEKEITDIEVALERNIRIWSDRVSTDESKLAALEVLKEENIQFAVKIYGLTAFAIFCELMGLYMKVILHRRNPIALKAEQDNEKELAEVHRNLAAAKLQAEAARLAAEDDMVKATAKKAEAAITAEAIELASAEAAFSQAAQAAERHTNPEAEVLRQSGSFWQRTGKAVQQVGVRLRKNRRPKAEGQSEDFATGMKPATS